MASEGITAEQLYYIIKVYPETISKEEAEKVCADLTCDKSYWEAAADIINRLCGVG